MNANEKIPQLTKDMLKKKLTVNFKFHFPYYIFVMIINRLLQLQKHHSHKGIQLIKQMSKRVKGVTFVFVPSSRSIDIRHSQLNL